ncbi:DNA cytosine methyltransferase [Bacillus pumilus]|uniref:DNA cytosine methyltransferase n=1 Tax=Bacillus pumilus TaxID=1408 RepID=UPI001C56D9EF|nr:DNA cytosine methyltransferase [Bacillus pumilus]
MKVVDLFSGCGGMSLGFQNAGFEIVSAFENWDEAVSVYNANFKHPCVNLDLSQVEDYSVFKQLNPEIIIGGPPCQDYSSSGNRIAKDNANLTTDFANIVVNVKPKFFLMENVDQIKKYDVYDKAVNIFKSAGYGLTSKILDASLCGVPQKRKRFFLFGEFNGTDDSFLPFLEKNLSKKPMTLRDYFGNSLGIEHYYRHPRNYNRRGVFSIDEPSPTIRGVNRPVPSGYPGHHNDTAPVTEVRPLTTLERSYVQTFPAYFDFLSISKTNLEQMIGNAVPVKMAEYVANAINEYVKNKNSLNEALKQDKQMNMFEFEVINI